MNKIEIISLSANPSSQPNLKQAYNRIQNQVNRGSDGFLFAVKRLTSTDSPYTMNINDSALICDTTSGSITINLLPALQWEEKRLTVKKIISANTVTVEGDGSETIDGSANASITTQYDSLEFISQGGSIWKV